MVVEDHRDLYVTHSKMPRFVVGDELGNLKVLRVSSENNVALTAIYQKKSSSVEALAVGSQSSGTKTNIAGFSDGSALVYSLKDDDSFDVLSEWKESRSKESKFIGLSLSPTAAFTCTSNGALRMTPIFSGNRDDSQPSSSQLASLPTRLTDWRLSPNGEAFAYGGDEVDLSVWNTELAFQHKPENDTSVSTKTTKKRKRGDELFLAETWRAKNVPNDSLGLRQPIRISSVTFLSSSLASQHLLTGTLSGDVRRYDTRASRRPVAIWGGIGKIGGVKLVKEGLNENGVFVSDHGCNLFSLDLRTGGIVYGYKGISGAITAIAPSPSIMMSTSLDRYARAHSVIPPLSSRDRKGEILQKLYLTGVPTAAVWDHTFPGGATAANEESAEEEDDVWDKMVHVGDDDPLNIK